MFEDIAKDIKAQLYEKARSPLAATFICAWLVINVRTVLVFFSALHVDEKIAYFDAANPTLTDWILHSLIYPLASAVVILLIYPHLARVAYEYWQRQYLKVKKIQQKIEDETPITQEEAKALRKASIEQQINLETQLSSSSARNSELQKQITELRQQLSEVRGERETLLKELDAKEKQIEALDKKTDSKISDDTQIKRSTVNLQNQDFQVSGVRLPEKVIWELRNAGLESSAIDLFTATVLNEGVISPTNLIKNLKGIEKLDMVHAMSTLSNSDFAYSTNDGTIKLTDNGLRLAVESGLTKALKTSI